MAAITVFTPTYNRRTACIGAMRASAARAAKILCGLLLMMGPPTRQRISWRAGRGQKMGLRSCISIKKMAECIPV